MGEYKHIVLVDDDLDDHLLFEESLIELDMGLELTHFENGELLGHYITENPDMKMELIFLDLNMPRMNGKEFLAKFAQYLSSKQIPVVVFSTSFNREEIQQIKSLGASYYFRKPPAFNDLKKGILYILKDLKKITQEQFDKEIVLKFRL